MISRRNFRKGAILIALVLGLSCSLRGRNEVLGEVQFVGWGKVERTSGVWVDGQYVGYLDELKGSKKVLLPPGKHEVVIQQAGYKDVSHKFVVNPGEIYTIKVLMDRDPEAKYSLQTASIKLQVRPKRAAVFVDGMFAGHVDEFDGAGQAMLVAPGKHQIEITLPGFKTFRTEVNLFPFQKFKIQTDLVPGTILDASTPLVEKARTDSK